MMGDKIFLFIKYINFIAANLLSFLRQCNRHNKEISRNTLILRLTFQLILHPMLAHQCREYGYYSQLLFRYELPFALEASRVPQ